MRNKKDRDDDELIEDRPPIEKGDFKAMLISGFLVIGIPSLIIIGVVLLVTFLIFA